MVKQPANLQATSINSMESSLRQPADGPYDLSSTPSDIDGEKSALDSDEDSHKSKRRFPKPGIGIWLDLKDRLPWYWQDWTDSWDYRVIPSVVETYFNNLLPAIAFAQDMFDRTDNAYGVNEVLLASAMGGIVFGALSGQPLCIVGVTGPISISTTPCMTLSNR